MNKTNTDCDFGPAIVAEDARQLGRLADAILAYTSCVFNGVHLTLSQALNMMANAYDAEAAVVAERAARIKANETEMRITYNLGCLLESGMEYGAAVAQAERWG